MILGYITLAVVLLGVGTFATFELRNRNKQEKSTNEVEAATTPRRASWRNLSLSPNRWLRRAPNTNMVLLLQTWVTENVKDKKLREWFEAQSDDEVKQLVDRLVSFSKDTDFDLLWLLEKDVERDSQLTKELTNALNLQLQAYYTSEQVSSDVAVFQVYQSIRKNPGRNLKRLQTLYTELVSQKVSDAPSPEMVIASGTDRQDYMLQQVEAAAEKDWKKVSGVLAEVMEKEAEDKANQEHILNRLNRFNPFNRTANTDATPATATDATATAETKTEDKKETTTKVSTSSTKKAGDSGSTPSPSPA